MRDKTEARTPEESEKSLPFFARFLEGQDATEGSRRSLKYPSDRDEDGDFRLEYALDNNE